MDAANRFLLDVREGSVSLRGRVKKDAVACMEAFREGMLEAFPEAKEKPFAGSVARLWVRWLAGFVDLPPDTDPDRFSRDIGIQVGEILKSEYEEGVAGNLAPFLLDRRLHLGSVHPYLQMRRWLAETVENLRRSPEASKRERGEILNSNFSSIVLRALHNAGPGYAAEVVEKLPSMIGDLELAIRNLEKIEPEAARHLRNNRATIITRALHSGQLSYGERVSETLPTALKNFEARIDSLESSSPEKAESLRANKRSLVYRALTNGRLDRLRSN